MLAGVAQAGVGAHAGQQMIEVLGGVGEAVGGERRRLGAAVFQRRGDGADAPGRADAGAADHHGAGAGGGEHGARVLDAAAIAVDDDGNFHRCDDITHRRASPPRLGRTGSGCARAPSPS